MGAKAAASPVPNVNGIGGVVPGSLDRDVVGRGRREMGRLLTPVRPLGKGMPVERTTLGVVVAVRPTLSAAAGVGRWDWEKLVPLATRDEVSRWTKGGSTGPVWNIFSLEEALCTTGGAERAGPARRTGELRRVDDLDDDVREPPNPGREGLGTGTGRDVGRTGDVETGKVGFAELSFERASVDDIARRCGLEMAPLPVGCDAALPGLNLAVAMTLAGRVFWKSRAGEGFKLSKKFGRLACVSPALLSLSQLATSSFIWRNLSARPSVSSPSPSSS